MAANVLQNYNQNPYDTDRPTQLVVLFSSMDLELNQLLRISPIALRVMLSLASRLNASGYAAATLDELAQMLGSSRSYVNQGILELADCYLITKKKQGEYWLKPQAFRHAQIEV